MTNPTPTGPAAADAVVLSEAELQRYRDKLDEMREQKEVNPTNHLYQVAAEAWLGSMAPRMLAHIDALAAERDRLQDRVVHLEVALHKIREYNYSGPFLTVYIKEVLEAGGGCCTPALRTDAE